MLPSDFYSALYKEDLNHIHIHNDIINEDVLKDETINELFNNVIKNKRTLMNIEEILDYIPLNTNWYRLLRKSKYDRHRLYVDICDFSATNFFNELKYFSKDKISNDELIFKAIELASKLTEHTDGAFITFDNHTEFGIMFINETKGLNLFTFKHELLHYLNWIKGSYKNPVTADESFYEKEINIICSIINKNFSSDYLEYLTSSHEYDSLLNNFLDLLKNIKSKYFNDMKPHDFAKMIVGIIKKNYGSMNCSEITRETDEDYCRKLMSYDFFKEIKNQASFDMIVFFMMIKHKVTNITNHIYGSFT